MATYEQLANSSYTDVVVPFVSDNGLGVQDSCTKQLSGYTLENTVFTFMAQLSALENTYIGASMDKLIWDFGDGTYSTGVSVTKHYKYPGDYNVTTIFTDQNGVTHRNTISQPVKIYNFIPDSLVWYTPTIADPNGGRPERALCGVPSNDLSIYRMNSWQSWPMVSGDGGYFINLYATGSKSRPLSTDQYWSDPDTHLTPSWRFVQGKQSKVPVERIQTENDYVYVKIIDNNLVKVPSTETGAIFAGTSGVATVNYLDDNPNRLTSARPTEPSNNTSAAIQNNDNMSEDEISLAQIDVEDKDIILYASFDTSKFPVTRKDNEIARFELLKSDYFQMYETQKIGMPIQVRYNLPTELSLSSNGINEPGFDITSYKFLNSPMSVVTRTKDLSGNVITTNNVTSLSSRWTAPTTSFSAGMTTTDVLTSQGFVTMYLSGQKSTFDTVLTPYRSEEDFKMWDIGQMQPKQMANKYIRILGANPVPLSATGQHELIEIDTDPIRYENVTVLFSELQEDQQRLLMSTGLEEHTFTQNVTGTPRKWFLRSDTTSPSGYFGYISSESNYKDDETIDMQLHDVTETYETPGSYLTYVNLNSNTFTYDSEKTKYRLYAQTLIDPPTTFTYDVTYYYITNPTNDVLWQIKPTYYREYSYGDEGLTQTYTPPISTQTPGNSGMYGLAVDPDGDVIAVDGDTDKIIRYWRNRTSRNEIKICDALPPEIRAKHYPYDAEAYGYSPSSVSMDKNRDYWVTMYDTISAVKFSGETDEPIAYAVPPVSADNRLVNVRTTDPSDRWTPNPVSAYNTVSGVEGEYGEYLIVPTTVETCRNNDIVVTYTNPLCSFIARYDPDGNFLYQYDLPYPDRYFSGDVCVDVSDHVWALSESTGLDETGAVDMNPPRSHLHAFDEELTPRFTVSTITGTDYQDMLKPTPHKNEEKTITLNMSQEYDFDQQRYYETALLVEGFGSIQNPSITLYEGNTYYFENQYYNNGQHDLRFRRITENNLTTPTSADIIDFDMTGSIINDDVEGYETSQIKMLVTKDTPLRFLLVDLNYSNTIGLVVNVIKKPQIDSRPPESFDIMNNATHLVPDNNNNIWISWGSRHCSRYNQTKSRIDTTVSVGSAYYDPRFDPLSADTYDRRDNAGRRSAIEGLAMDTANNLLVINNHDKTLYSINSDQPTLSAYVNLSYTQIPFEDFSWVESLSNNRLATQDDFTSYPNTYLTKEQIEVFLPLSGKELNHPEHEKYLAAQNYNEHVLSSQTGREMFPTHHGANPATPTGFEQELCAYGDWTGFRWINKYDPRPVPSDSTTGFVSITGCSEEFHLVPQSGTHEVVKVNENVDFAQVIRSYMKQPGLMNNTKLYNELNDVVFGTNMSDISSMGKRIYERISNYVSNTVDIDTCTIQALFGLAEMVNYELISTGYPVPTELQRLIDLLSINFTKLRGMAVSESQDFEKYGNWTQDRYGVNLGPELVFVFDWKTDHGYKTGDYAKYNGVYYACTSTLTSSNVLPSVDRGWEEIQNDEIRVYTEDQARKIYKSYTKSNKEHESYDDWYVKNNPVTKKLIQNLTINVDDKLVLHEEYTGEHRLVQSATLGLLDPREYEIYLSKDSSGYMIQQPPSSRDLLEERAGLVDTYEPLFTMFDDGLITLIGDTQVKDMTMVLFRNRTYTFAVTSYDHPMIITENPGVSATPTEYVATQGIQRGNIIIRTHDDPVFGKFPDKLYYQSSVDPAIGGAILIKDVEETRGYSTQYDGLTSYNLNLSVSSQNQLGKLGWGLSFPEGANAWQFYSIYEYVEPTASQTTYIDNVIDWEDPMTTLTFEQTASGNNIYNNWFDDGGNVDIMLEKVLRNGLDMFSGHESIATFEEEE